MANWCKGILKARGEKNNLYRWIKNNFKKIDRGVFFETSIQLSDEYEGGTQAIIIKDMSQDKDVDTENTQFWIRGSNRAFINKFHINDFRGDEIEYLAFDYTQANMVSAELLKSFSEEYNIDFKITAFEPLLEFKQEVCVEQGEIKKDTITEYNNFIWECSTPFI